MFLRELEEKNRKKKKGRFTELEAKQSKAKVPKSKSVTKALSQGELGSSELSDGGPDFLGASEEWSHTATDRFCG